MCEKYKNMSAIEQLRTVVKLCNHTHEEFLNKFTINQLITLWYAYRECGWDFTPDKWTENQVEEALKGNAPNWDDQEKPIESIVKFEIYPPFIFQVFEIKQ